MKTKYHLFLLAFIISGCCADMSDIMNGTSQLCQDEVFTETKKIGFTFEYVVNTTNTFAEVNTVTAENIRKALQVPDDNFTLKKIEITSGKVEYGRFDDNTAPAMFLNIAITGNTFNQLLLLTSNQLLPLIDIPETPLNQAVKINEFFNTEGIKGLKELLRDYVLLLNDDGINFALVGEVSPKNLTAHFKLNLIMYVSITYEVCHFVPLGEGERVCE